MPEKLIPMHGTDVEADRYIGESAEITMDETNNTIRVHDGVKQGGHPLARVDQPISDFEGIDTSGNTNGDVLGFNEDGDLVPVTIQAGAGGTQADWDEGIPSSASFIKNKPTIPAPVDISGKEDSLNNPTANGYILASQTDGTRSWVSPTSGDTNVQSDWNESDNTSDAFIANKPTIPAAGDSNVQSDWNQSDNTSDSFIANKPTIEDYSGKEDGLGNPVSNGQVLTSQTDGTRSWATPASTGEENVKANWSETDTNSDAFIQNKPEVPIVSKEDFLLMAGGYGDTTDINLKFHGQLEYQPRAATTLNYTSQYAIPVQSYLQIVTLSTTLPIVTNVNSSVVTYIFSDYTVNGADYSKGSYIQVGGGSDKIRYGSITSGTTPSDIVLGTSTEIVSKVLSDIKTLGVHLRRSAGSKRSFYIEDLSQGGNFGTVETTTTQLSYVRSILTVRVQNSDATDDVKVKVTSGGPELISGNSTQQDDETLVADAMGYLRVPDPTPPVGGEPVLGNPTTDGQILSSTVAGSRSWIDAPSGGSSINSSFRLFEDALAMNSNALATMRLTSKGEVERTSADASQVWIKPKWILPVNTYFEFGSTVASNEILAARSVRLSPITKFGISYNEGFRVVFFRQNNLTRINLVTSPASTTPRSRVFSSVDTTSIPAPNIGIMNRVGMSYDESTGVSTVTISTDGVTEESLVVDTTDDLIGWDMEVWDNRPVNAVGDTTLFNFGTEPFQGEIPVGAVTLAQFPRINNWPVKLWGGSVVGTVSNDLLDYPLGGADNNLATFDNQGKFSLGTTVYTGHSFTEITPLSNNASQAAVSRVTGVGDTHQQDITQVFTGNTFNMYVMNTSADTFAKTNVIITEIYYKP